MAAHTVTYLAPGLELLKASVATGDTIVNNTKAVLEVVEGLNTSGVVTRGIDVTRIAAGVTYTVLAAQNGKALYVANQRESTLSTVPTLLIA